MADLVERLRTLGPDDSGFRRIGVEAATEIVALRERVSVSDTEVARLAKRLETFAIGFDVPDGGRYIADWQSRISKYKTAEDRAETAERELKAATANHSVMASQMDDMARKLDDLIGYIESWTTPQTMKLRAGEMTAQEVRTVKAVLTAVLDHSRACIEAKGLKISYPISQP